MEYSIGILKFSDCVSYIPTSYDVAILLNTFCYTKRLLLKILEASCRGASKTGRWNNKEGHKTGVNVLADKTHLHHFGPSDH